MNKNIFFGKYINNTSKYDFKPIQYSYYSSPYFIILDNIYKKEVPVKDQIYTHQYRIGIDNNGNLIIYTLKGIQLAYKDSDIAGHFWAHVALDNTSNGWHFANSIDYYSNNLYSLGMLAAASDVFYTYDEFFKINNRRIYAFMYRKITNNEILKYITEENIIK